MARLPLLLLLSAAALAAGRRSPPSLTAAARRGAQLQHRLLHHHRHPLAFSTTVPNSNRPLGSPDAQGEEETPRRLLGPGSRVAVAGAHSLLGRLVTVKLAQNQFRPYVLVPEGTDPPNGLGLDRYWGITKHVMMDESVALPPEIEGLIMVDEKGYSPDTVKALLSSLSDNVKKVVMLSSLGVERRDDLMMKLKTFSLKNLLNDLDVKYEAEKVLTSTATEAGFDFTLIRTGKLRGGGGDMGLGDEMYWENPNVVEAKMDEAFDEQRRGFTMSFSDNVDGETGRILAAEAIIKALSSEGVSNTALALVSEPGRTFPNFQIAPWDLF